MIIKITSDFLFLIYTLIIVLSFYLVDVLRSSIMSQLIILSALSRFQIIIVLITSINLKLQ
jgi:hypothetical protein